MNMILAPQILLNIMNANSTPWQFLSDGKSIILKQADGTALLLKNVWLKQYSVSMSTGSMDFVKEASIDASFGGTHLQVISEVDMKKFQFNDIADMTVRDLFKEINKKLKKRSKG